MANGNDCSYCERKCLEFRCCLDSVFAVVSYSLPKCPEKPGPVQRKMSDKMQVNLKDVTYAGNPTPTATAASIVFPFPYPRALYISPANSGNAKPASDRRQDAAAIARYPLVSE